MIYSYFHSVFISTDVTFFVSNKTRNWNTATKWSKLTWLKLTIWPFFSKFIHIYNSLLELDLFVFYLDIKYFIWLQLVLLSVRVQHNCRLKFTIKVLILITMSVTAIPCYKFSIHPYSSDRTYMRNRFTIYLIFFISWTL